MKEEEFYDAVDAGLDKLEEKFDEMMVSNCSQFFIHHNSKCIEKLKVIFSFQTEKAAAASQHSKISLNPEHPLYNEVI